MLLPYAILGVLTLVLLVGGVYGWDYTNSPTFCGTSCHTMPPQNATYIASPHANVYCTECHIGRSFLGNQVARKTEDVREVIAMLFHTYEFPIVATRSRPARETCEKCHLPEAFSDDSLRVITHFQADRDNSPYSIYLIMKTGGGTKREGLGRGIHWHTINRVVYYAADTLNQNIPYIRVYNDDGTTTEYMDIETGFDPATLDESKLKEVDCITCHNRISHDFIPPADSVDNSMARGLIATDIPEIRAKAVEVLSAHYTSHQDALAAISRLEQFYKDNEAAYYKKNADKVTAAIQTIINIYERTIFIDQRVDWTTHPNNIGHVNSPGCFRCHDGKHLNTEQEAIRLECNLCHAIPVVATAQDFVTKIEISRGPVPQSHLNPNWITLHRSVFDATCSNCHTTENVGGTTNTSFCSNSACHGTAFSYAGFDAPKLREILQAQLPTPPPAPTPSPVSGPPTYETSIKALFEARCVICHNTAAASAGLDLSLYAGVMQGGQAGTLIKIQSAKHFANLTPEELELVKQWIDAGAIEK